MKWMRSLFPILLVAVVVAAMSDEARAGGRRPRAKIESVTALTGQSMAVAMLVRDREARDLPLILEYKVKGTKGWHPATVETDVSAVPSSEEGEQFVAAWNAFADLGTRHSRKVRLRVIVDIEKGKKKKSRRFEVVLYGRLDSGGVSAVTYPDLMEDGSLDNTVLIDTRSAAHFAAAAIPGAINLDAADIEEQGEAILDFPKDTRLIFYCYGGL
ncbi:MAG: rhodanese-like domain-containing protein [Planctomycetota bacterium]